ncbi:hypothetical protein [Microbacterium sp. CJ88]|uniref:hypothetical protein n=1 Tax=Microbacterium sp. CJ88 TaxID=3445672 RepID=UPI003F65A767
MDATVDAIVEIFAWAGFGLGAVVGGIALVLFLLDGTWVPVRAVVEQDEHDDGRRLVRWFDEQGEANEAPLHADQHPGLHEGEMVDVYARRGWRDRMRTTPGSPAVRGARLLAIGLLSLGAVSLALSWVLLFARG